jgi:hypothetical protein
MTQLKERTAPGSDPGTEAAKSLGAKSYFCHLLISYRDTDYADMAEGGWCLDD